MKAALQLYKEFIDDIVEISEGVERQRVMRRGWPKLKENEEINRFLSELTRAQKKLLSRLLEEAREGGIHDLLVYISTIRFVAGLCVWSKTTRTLL